jgi:UDP-GlcNAc3NAcA epimerase
MVKILTVIGARPQIIKAAALSRAIGLAYHEKIKEVIVHTGQHYDDNMSRVFFDEMKIPKPNYNLNVGSGNHGKQTAKMIKGLEEVLQKESPSGVVVYGDTNSTLATAIAASKMQIPILHIEAGLRSFNKSMPEEINRILCDHVSTLLFTPTEAGYYNLLSEGFSEGNDIPYTIDNPKIYHCGDVMYDNMTYFSELGENYSLIIDEHGLANTNFILATIHRDNNTDDPKRLNKLFSVIMQISNAHDIPVVLPLHPRTSKILKKNLSAKIQNLIKTNENIHILPPVSYLDMIALERSAAMIMTDSGGVQKEAYFFKKPCII